MNRLKYWRQERKLSQYELGSASNKPRWVIQLIEAGIRGATHDEQQAFSEALGVHAQELFPSSKGSEDNHAK